MEYNRQSVFSFWTIFCPFTEKSKFWKKEKAWSHHLTLVYHKWQSYDVVWFLRYKVQWTELFGEYFLPFRPPLQTWKIKILIKWKKNSWRYYHLYHKCINENHDIWFLRYGMWQTEFFLTLDHFLPFYSPNNLKNHNFDKMKK